MSCLKPLQRPSSNMSLWEIIDRLPSTGIDAHEFFSGQQRQRFGDQGWQIPCGQTDSTASRPRHPVQLRTDARGMERVEASGDSGGDHPGQHIAGTGGGQPLIGNGREQHPAIGVGDDCRRAFE